MTRCYEFYCMFKTTPQRCELKDRATLWRIDSYMKRFEDKGIKFDYDEKDKELFYELHDEIGTERQVGRVGHDQPLKKPKEVQVAQTTTQKAHDFGKPKLYRCGFPGCQKGAYYPKFYGEVPVCPDCNKKIQLDPSLAERLKEKPSQPERTEKKTYEKIKPSWAERKAQMHPRVSKMETAIALRLQEKGISFQEQTEFCLVRTTPDFYFPSKNLAIYLDGEKVHRKREAKDEFLREKLQKRHGVKAVAIVYKDNSKLSEDEIFVKLLEVLK